MKLLIPIFFFVFVLGCADLHVQEFSLDLNELLKEFSVDLDKQPKLLPKQKTTAEICQEKRKITNTKKIPTNKGDLITLINTAISNGGNSVDLSYIDTSKIPDMSELFKSKANFNGDISCWDVSSVTSMYGMFNGAAAFNQDISNWDVSSVTDMSYMFTNATAFNQNISKWNIESVTDMSYMFASATAFNNGDISGSSNKPLTWRKNTSKVKNMEGMFYGAHAFNQDLFNWNVSGVTNMSYMFHSATAFNNGGNPLTWGSKTKSVTDMNRMFVGATAFNSDISNWNVSSVTNMKQMFQEATAFNQDLSSWNVSRVTDMRYMFYKATAFNNGGNPFGLNTWTINTNRTTITNMFIKSLMASRGQYPSWCTLTGTNKCK